MDYGTIGKMLEEIGFPQRDCYDLPDSPHRFPDGAHYRIEVSGIERLSTLELFLNENEKQNVPVQRLICTVMGSTYLPREELIEFARLTNEAKVEVIISPGPRASWEVGSKQRTSEEGFGAGGNFRGMDNVINYIRDVMRCIDLGFRGFLIGDAGLLYIMNELRKAGKIPADVVFKVSVSVGAANPGNIKVLEDCGAASINPVCDTTFPQLAAMRKVTNLPLDLHIIGFDTEGGINRMWDVGELARVGAPIYFKVEPGTSFSQMYKPWQREFNDKFIRDKVSMARIIQEIMKETNPDLISSAHTCDDLRIPHIV